MNYRSKEAFCLMMYVNEATGAIEWLWNSRDGVTPFCIFGAENEEHVLRHADWFRDVRAPFYVPPIGSRIFVDLTETRAKARAVARMEAIEAHGNPEQLAQLRERYESRDAAISTWTASELERPGAPDILVVNAGMQAEFLARVPLRPSLGPRFA